MPLSKNFVERKVHVEIVSGVIQAVRVEPPSGRRELHGEENDKEGVGDEACREVADALDSGLSKVFVDEIRRDEDNRPDDYAGG